MYRFLLEGWYALLDGMIGVQMLSKEMVHTMNWQET